MDIGQSTPYPGKINTISVSLLANIPLQAASSITLSNFAGAQTASGAIDVRDGVGFGSSPSNYFTSANGAALGKGMWDFQAKSLTLVVTSSIPAGTLIQISFNLLNPTCAQESPPVCLRASDISPTNCSSCALGRCVSVPRALMRRDFVSVYGTGVMNALYPFVKYSTAAAVTYGDSVQGDAYPLKVYGSSFIVKRIGQSTSFPSKTNQITVTLATSVPLVAGSQVTIFGLTGTSTTTNPSLTLIDQWSSGFSTCFGSSASWTQGNGTLILTVTSDTVAGTQYTFSFTLQNPPCPQSPPPISISVSPICFVAQLMCADMSTPSASSAGFFQPSAGDSQALLVKAPAFRVANIWQKNPYPGSANTIHIEVATNVNVPAGSQFIVSGLTGSTTPDGPLNLWFPASDAESLASSSASSAAFSSPAVWTRSSGNVLVTIQAETLANITFRFSFSLQNPLCCQSPRNVLFSMNLPCFQNTAASWKSQTSLDSSVVVFGETGETAPLLVRCPLWKIALVSPSSNNPCTNSLHNLTLQLNVPVNMADGVTITLSGMGDSLTANGIIAINSTVVAQGNWTGGALRGAWSQKSTAAYEVVTILFTLTNPANSSAYIARSVSISAISATTCLQPV